MASRAEVLAVVREVISQCSGDDPELDAWLARTVAAKKLPPIDEISFFVAHSHGVLVGINLSCGSQDRRFHRANARSGAVLVLAALAEKKSGPALGDFVVMIHAALEAARNAPELQNCKNSGGR